MKKTYESPYAKPAAKPAKAMKPMKAMAPVAASRPAARSGGPVGSMGAKPVAGLAGAGNALKTRKNRLDKALMEAGG